MEHGHLLPQMPEKPLIRSHHETTHLIQHHLFSIPTWRELNPVIPHAEKQHVSLMKLTDMCMYPVKETVTYFEPTSEVLAHQEGHKINLAIEALGLITNMSYSIVSLLVASKIEFHDQAVFSQDQTFSRNTSIKFLPLPTSVDGIFYLLAENLISPPTGG